MYRANFNPNSTPQEIYDEIKNAAEAGSFPSQKNSECLYRCEDRACLFGIFIPDSRYSPVLEGLTSQAVFDKNTQYYDGSQCLPLGNLALNREDYPTFFFVKNRIDETLIKRLQSVHDNIATLWNKEEFLEDVREAFKAFGYIVV